MLTFRQFAGVSGEPGLSTFHPHQVLEYALRGADWSAADELPRRRSPLIPVTFRYKDTGDHDFQTTCIIAWASMNHTGQVQHTKAGQAIVQPSWLQHLGRRIYKLFVG